tara:strand:- start:508 stop:762 length:255 start_codon:yes stop_codon:yes gene_type:complete
MKTFYEVKFIITMRSELDEKVSLSSTRVIYNIQADEIEDLNIHGAVMKLEKSLLAHHKEIWKEKNISIFLEYIKAIKEPYKFDD